MINKNIWHAESCQCKHEKTVKSFAIKDARTAAFDVVLVCLQWALNIFGTFFWCLYCQLTAGKCRLERSKFRVIYFYMVFTTMFEAGDSVIVNVTYVRGCQWGHFYDVIQVVLVFILLVLSEFLCFLYCFC